MSAFPLEQDAKNMDGQKTFIISKAAHGEILGRWFDIAKRAYDSLPQDKRNLWDVSTTMRRMAGLTIDDCIEWRDIAHDMKDCVGASFLCEVMLKFE